MRTDDLRALGLDDETINKIQALNGKDIEREKNKADGKAEQLKTEIEALKKDIEHRDSLLEEANQKITSFEQIDTESLKSEIESWKSRVEEQAKLAEEQKKIAEEQQAQYQAELAKRDYKDAYMQVLDGIKFSSEGAKRDVIRQFEEAKLPMQDGTLLGAQDLLEAIKAKDAGAFVNEVKAPHFGVPQPERQPQTYSIGELMKLKEENPNFDFKKYMKLK